MNCHGKHKIEKQAVQISAIRNAMASVECIGSSGSLTKGGWSFRLSSREKWVENLTWVSTKQIPINRHKVQMLTQESKVNYFNEKWLVKRSPQINQKEITRCHWKTAPPSSLEFSESNRIMKANRIIDKQHLLTFSIKTFEPRWRPFFPSHVEENRRRHISLKNTLVEWIQETISGRKNCNATYWSKHIPRNYFSKK